MDRLFSNLKFTAPEKIYVKDPESSELGKKIIAESIKLIHQHGFEDFTFKKLGAQINSNESSIYRYFENKHKLLVYLFSWYWSYKEHQLVFETHNLEKAGHKLMRAIEVVSGSKTNESNFMHINEGLLYQIMICENNKSFLTKEVDKENKEGYFQKYKAVIYRLVEMITAVNPAYPYPSSLASTVIDGALHQQFLKEHLTSITNCNESITPTDFYKDLVLRTLQIDGYEG